MIFLDTNVFLRLFAPATSRTTERMKRESRELFEAIGRGTIEATTSEAVLHEVCYVLRSPRQYGLDAERVVSSLQPMLGLSGMTFPGRDLDIYIQALERMRAFPRLSFVDSVISVRAQVLNAQLVTYDEYLANQPFVTRWKPGQPG
jgi:predicted nucleic acid-binding protein